MPRMPLPFELVELSRGYAELTREARALGADAAAAAARGLGAVLGCEVSLAARAVPAPVRPRPATSRVALELCAAPARAALEVDPALVVRLVELLGGEPGDGAGATSLTPVEAAALDLFVLAALDAVCALPGVETPLAPRLSEGTVEVAGALGVEIDVVAGTVSGRARLLLPPAALRMLRGGAPACAGPSMSASLRSGAVTLAPEELEALAPGDVVVLEPAENGVEELVLPGGRRLRGRREDGAFRLEETTMAERCAQIPITLDVELARVDVPVAELARLEPGGVLPLALDRRGLVTLRAGERAVARGELVELEGAIGVRILSVEVAP